MYYIKMNVVNLYEVTNYFKLQSVSAAAKYVFSKDGTVTKDMVRIKDHYYSGKFNNILK